MVTNLSTGCQQTSLPVNAVVNSLPNINITPTGSLTFCSGGSVSLGVNTSSGWVYQWRLNGAIISGATNAAYSATSSGSFSVSVTDANNCTQNSSPVSVNVLPLPISTITNARPTRFCDGDSVVLFGNSGLGLTYQWRINGSPIPGATNNTFISKLSGIYELVVTSSTGCSTLSQPVSIIVDPLPSSVITSSGSTSFCSGNNVTLSVPLVAGHTYRWFLGGSPILNGQGSSLVISQSGQYSVEVTSANGCVSRSAAVSVTVNPLPAASLSPTSATTFCTGGSVNLNAPTGVGFLYIWYKDGLVMNGFSSASYTATLTGNYSVQIVDALGCTSLMSSVVPVTVQNLPLATISFTSSLSFCQGNQVVLSANSGVGLGYQWFLNGAIIQGSTLSTHSASISGSYTVMVTNLSTGCQQTSLPVSVNVHPSLNPVVTVNGPTTFCQGDSVLLISSLGLGQVRGFQWQLNGANLLGGNLATYSARSTGLYRVIMTDTFGCEWYSPNVSVLVYSLSANITPGGNTVLCQNQSVILFADTGTGYQYQWFLNGTIITGIQGNASFYTASVAGSYTVLIVSLQGCSAFSAAVPVIVNPIPSVTILPITPVPICQGASTILVAQPGGFSSYQWFFNNNPINGATLASLSASDSGIYSVTVIDSNGCTGVSSSVNLVVNSNPVVSLSSSSPIPLCSGQTLQLVSNSSVGGIYSLYFNGLLQSSNTTGVFAVNSSGNYRVVLVDSNGCSGTSNLLPVNFLPLPNTTIQTVGNVRKLCQGDSITLRAQYNSGYSYQWLYNNSLVLGAVNDSLVIFSTGVYNVIITNDLGCTDTSVNFVVEQGTITSIRSARICQNRFYVFYGDTISSPGVYTDTVVSISGGCDSIIELHLEVDSLPSRYLTDSIYPGTFYQLGSSVFNLPGFYIVYTSNPGGCDSVVYLTLLWGTPSGSFITRINSASGTIGDTVRVKIDLLNPLQFSALMYKIDFDTSSLSFLGVENPHPLLVQYFTTNFGNYNTTSGIKKQIRATWSNPSTPFLSNDLDICYLTFVIRKHGIFPITWSIPESYYYSIFGSTIPGLTWLNGYVFSNPLVISQNPVLSSDQLFVYPNPTSGESFLKISRSANFDSNTLESFAKLRITDLSGRLLRNSEFRLDELYEGYKLDLLGLSQGTYCISISNNNLHWKGKVVIRY
jgi:hypothetical protein